MYVIGISSGIKHGHHDGAAVLLRDGELIAAAEEERFTLSKHARGELPRGAIGFCLKQAGITIQDVDWICSPLKTYVNYRQRLTEYFKFQFGFSPKIELYDHHLCHAASSFYGSGFPEATVICFDFSGDFELRDSRPCKGRQFPRIDALWQAQQPRAVLWDAHSVPRLSNDQRRIQGHGNSRRMEFRVTWSNLLPSCVLTA